MEVSKSAKHLPTDSIRYPTDINNYLGYIYINGGFLSKIRYPYGASIKKNGSFYYEISHPAIRDPTFMEPPHSNSKLDRKVGHLEMWIQYHLQPPGNTFLSFAYIICSFPLPFLTHIYSSIFISTNSRLAIGRPPRRRLPLHVQSRAGQVLFTCSRRA